MPIVRTNPISIIDNIKNTNANLYLSSNHPSTQINDLNTASFSPSWKDTPLVITPSVYINNNKIALSDSKLTVSWQRKSGASYGNLVTNEVASNGILTVKDNVLKDAANKYITYKCTIVYNESITCSQEITFNLITDARAIIFDIYSDSGLIISKETESPITLKTIAYDGSIQITNASYQWYKFQNNSWISSWDVYESGEDGSVAIVTNQSELKVYFSEVASSQSYKCVMTYNGKEYSKVVTVTDKTDTYSAQIITLGGATIKNGQNGVIAYTVTFKGTEEIDKLVGPICDTLPSSPADESYCYLLNRESIILKKYTNEGWENVESNPQEYQYNWAQISIDGTNITTLESSKKVVYISNESLQNSSIVQCTVGDIAVCQETFMDTNDPIISSSEPSNPPHGQLWLDTSVTPNVLKIYDAQSGYWSQVNSNSSNKVFSSAPITLVDGYYYRRNDLWIVSNDDVTKGYTTHRAGTLLVAVNSNKEEFDQGDWINKLYYDDELKDIGEYTNKLRAYFKFSYDGMRIGENEDGTGFYTKITPYDLGFYQGLNKIAYVSNNKMYNTDLEVKNTVKIIDYPEQDKQKSKTTSLTLDNFRFSIEDNGSMSLMRILNNAPKPYILSADVNSSYTKITLSFAFYSGDIDMCGYETTFDFENKIKFTYNGADCLGDIITTSKNKIIIPVEMLLKGTYQLYIGHGAIYNTGDGIEYTKANVHNDSITINITKSDEMPNITASQQP